VSQSALCFLAGRLPNFFNCSLLTNHVEVKIYFNRNELVFRSFLIFDGFELTVILAINMTSVFLCYEDFHFLLLLCSFVSGVCSSLFVYFC